MILSFFVHGANERCNPTYISEKIKYIEQQQKKRKFMNKDLLSRTTQAQFNSIVIEFEILAYISVVL